MSQDSRPAPVPDTLRSTDRLHADPEVAVHEETDTAPTEVVKTVASMDDLAPVGVTGSDGTLVLRVDETCERKIPCAAVPEGDDYADRARAWVGEQAGFEISLEGIEGVWRIDLTATDGGGSATREFVVFRATPAAGESPPVDGAALEGEWVTDLPEGAERPPGTDRLL